MRLDFNVLWVEDQQKAVMAQKDRIATQVRREGFRLQVVFAASVEEAANYLSDDIYGDHIDLVLMDFDLGAGGRGDQGLQEVRNRFAYKDVVFYSSGASDLPSIVAKDKVQGVFCSTRDELPDTVEGVFESLVKKVIDIDHSRGIVMGATSDIDHCVNDCLSSRFDKADEPSRQLALTVVGKHLTEKRKSFDKELESIAAVTHILELQEFHNIYTSNDRLRLLKSTLNGDVAHQISVDAIASYLKDTVPRRNDLAHVRVKAEGFSRKLFDRKGVELTANQMRTLRQELLRYQELFEGLLVSLR